eukprot:306599-Rhodomonas_salina.4
MADDTTCSSAQLARSVSDPACCSRRRAAALTSTSRPSIRVCATHLAAPYTVSTAHCRTCHRKKEKERDATQPCPGPPAAASTALDGAPPAPTPLRTASRPARASRRADSPHSRPPLPCVSAGGGIATAWDDGTWQRSPSIAAWMSEARGVAPLHEACAA